jgi:hypothetical protein
MLEGIVTTGEHIIPAKGRRERIVSWHDPVHAARRLVIT